MKRLAAAVLLGLTGMVAPAGAEGECYPLPDEACPGPVNGCLACQGNNHCGYNPRGPGTFVGASGISWIVRIYHPDGTWTNVVDRRQPGSATGDIPSAPGDIVFASVSFDSPYTGLVWVHDK